MRLTILTRSLLALGLLAALGCATGSDRVAQQFIAEMDALPPEEQVPNWAETRALMMREAPRIGDAAPDFTLETSGGSDSVTLSQLDASKPVVLVFGSWT
jgi:hypothetical protein